MKCDKCCEEIPIKHYFAIRMICEKSAQPMRELFSYATNNQQLTIEDFIKINSNPDFSLICYFYIGYGDKSILDKYAEIIGRHIEDSD